MGQVPTPRRSRSPDNPFRDRDGRRRKWRQRFFIVIASVLFQAIVARLTPRKSRITGGIIGSSNKNASPDAYCTDRLRTDRTIYLPDGTAAASARDLLLAAMRARFASGIDPARAGNLRILVVEAGTGRDLESFHSMEGVEADGLDPCREFATNAERVFAEEGIELEIKKVGFSDNKKRSRGKNAARLWKTDLPDFVRAVRDDVLFALDDVGQYHGVFFCGGQHGTVPSLQMSDLLVDVAHYLLVEGGVILTCLPETKHADLVASVVSRRTGEPFQVIQTMIDKGAGIDGDEPRTAAVSGIDMYDPRVGRPSEFPDVLQYHHETSHHDKRHNALSGRGRKWSEQPDKFLVVEGPTDEGRVVPLPLTDLTDTKTESNTEGAGLNVPRFLQEAFGVTAWKETGKSRWSVRSHPSSGGLQTAEIYITGAAINPSLDRKTDDDGALRRTLWHYNSFWHALQRRGVVPESVWARTFGKFAEGAAEQSSGNVIFVLFSAVYYRNCWKYGEPGYWKTHLDAGHVIGSAAAAARVQGHRAVVLDAVDDGFLSEVMGLDKVGSERKICRTSRFHINSQQPVGLMAVIPEVHKTGLEARDDASNLKKTIASMDFSQGGSLLEKANFLHEHDAFRQDSTTAAKVADIYCAGYKAEGKSLARPVPEGNRQNYGSFWGSHISLSKAILERRTAKTYSAAESSMGNNDFLDVVTCLKTGCGIAPHFPWVVPGVHVLLFVHEVDEMEPGLYLLNRAMELGTDGPSERLHKALRNALPNTERVRPRRVADLIKGGLSSHEDLRESFFYVGGNFDTRRISQLLSREQDIARDDTFTVSFVGDLDHSLLVESPHWYRYVHWEAAALGHQLYLMAERLGYRGSGIGSFYNTMVRHFLFGDAGFSSQQIPFHPIYHFTFGKADYDDRINSHEPYHHLQELRGKDGGRAAMVTMVGY